MHRKDGTCYLCMELDNDFRRWQQLHEHHIFPGKNRASSEAEGLKVYLCLNHHIIGPNAVHNNKENMDYLKKEGQMAYERENSRERFIEIFGKSYIL